MALFLPGPMIADARGSVGGTTFSRNRHGAYTRNRVVPVNPASARQTAVRISVETLQQRWRETLTLSQRSAWTGYALGTPVPNKLGQQTTLTGINMYIRTNVIRINAGQSILDTAPATNGVAALPLLTISATVVSGIVITAISPNLAAGDILQSQFSPALARTVNFFGRGFVETNYEIGALAPPTVIKPPAGMAVGQRYFIRNRVVFADGRPSEGFTVFADVV